MLAGGIAAVGVLSLVVSNPSLEDYQTHAGDQLVRLGTKELCDEPTLPMVLRLWIRNCPELIASQRDALAALAGQFTTRRNLLVASLYSTRMERKEMLPGLRRLVLKCSALVWPVVSWSSAPMPATVLSGDGRPVA